MNTTRRPCCLVVDESMFDNAEDIAWAIADGLAGTFEVDRSDVVAAPDRREGISLLVGGAPTHTFGLSCPTTGSDAAIGGAEPDPAAGIGVREWPQRIERPAPGLPAAAFDTRPRRTGPPARNDFGPAAPPVAAHRHAIDHHHPDNIHDNTEEEP